MKRIVTLLLASTAASAAYAADYADPIMIQETVVAPRVMGHVEVYLGGLNISAEEEDDTSWVAGATGRVNAPINERWNVQTDVFVDHIDEVDVGSPLSITGYGTAVHLYWRNPQSFAFGVFGTLTGFDLDSSGTSQSAHSYTFGPEGQVYFGNVTLYGQAYWGQLEAGMGPGSEIDLMGVRGELRYFVHENFRLDGELGYRTLDVSFQEIDVFTAAAQATYRFSNSPFAVFGRYQYEQISTNSSSEEIDLHKFIIGFRGSFNSDSLLDEDRNGATMNTQQRNLIIY